MKMEEKLVQECEWWGIFSLDLNGEEEILDISTKEKGLSLLMNNLLFIYTNKYRDYIYIYISRIRLEICKIS